MTQDTEPKRAGYQFTFWLEQVGISRTTEHDLPAKLKPRKVRIGRRIIVLESPREWLLRVARRGGVPSHRSETRVAA